MPPVDRDESRFAQASRQMAQSGDYAVPRVRETPRLNKPPLIYWLQSLSARLFTGGDLSRDSIWMYRVPSLLGAIVAVLLTWRLGCSMFDPRAAWFGAALFAVCPIVAWEARQARADMVMTAVCAAALWLLWETLRRPAWTRALSLWIAVGFGVLVKGPIVPLVVVLALVGWCVLHRSVREAWRTKPWLGVLTVAAMVGPWVVLVAKQVGWSEYVEIIRRETLDRSVQPAEGHSGPPGYHLALAMVFMFPGSLWVGGSLWRAWRIGLQGQPSGAGAISRAWSFFGTMRAARPAECFLLCAIVPMWLVFELVSTKLPHYTMPLYPACTLLIARAALSDEPRLRSWVRQAWIAWGVRVWMIAGVLLAAGAAWLGWLAAEEGSLWGWCALAIGAAAALQFVVEGSVLISRRDYRALLERALRIGIVCMVLIGLTLPQVRRAWVVYRLVQAAEVAAPRGDRPLAFVSLHEDSSVFLTRGRVAWLGDDQVVAFVRDNPSALVVLPSVAADSIPGFRPLATVSGFNYSKGEWGQWSLGEFIGE